VRFHSTGEYMIEISDVFKSKSSVEINEYARRITNGILGFPHRKRLSDISNYCSKFIGLHIADIGCYDLYFDQKIIPNQDIFVGVDFSFQGLRFANENIQKYKWNNVHIINADGEYVPLVNNFFDLVLCCETLEHVNNEIAVLNEINRISKKDSILVISVPIEFGLILLFKQIIRRLFFSTVSYSLKELWYACIVCDLKRIKRYDHKGYDYRNIITFLPPEYKLIKKFNTPFKHLPDFLSYGTFLIFKKNKSK